MKLLFGGFLIGFGTRYAGGWTSGHFSLQESQISTGPVCWRRSASLRAALPSPGGWEIYCSKSSEAAMVKETHPSANEKQSRMSPFAYASVLLMGVQPGYFIC